MREPAGLKHRARVAVDEVAPVWVLDDPAAASGPLIGIAERLGVPHLRVPLRWNWRAGLASLPPGGSLLGVAHHEGLPWPLCAPFGPALALSAGERSRGVALWLRARFGTRIVHCGAPWLGLHASLFDLLVVPGRAVRPAWANRLPVLGVPHRLSPLVLAQARLSWAARLAHLPRPLIALLVSGAARGGPLAAAPAHAVARTVAGLAIAAGGSVLATTSPSTGSPATEAVAAGLASSMHLLHRWGEPGDNPFDGFIGLADAIIVTGGSVAMISQACAGDAPVFIAATPGDAALRGLHATLQRAGQARPLGDHLTGWVRTPLDEAGRVAAAIHDRLAVDPHALD